MLEAIVICLDIKLMIYDNIIYKYNLFYNEEKKLKINV